MSKQKLPDFRTMRFEDKDQDFTWWTITEHGDIVGCGPFQGSVWTKCKVVNHHYLRAGDKPVFKSPHIAKALTLSYRIVAIWEGFDHMEPKAAAAVCSECAVPLDQVAACTCVKPARKLRGYSGTMSLDEIGRQHSSKRRVRS